MTTPSKVQIVTDEDFSRSYIPIGGGWEIQTRGKGSTFRICDASGDRLAIPDSPYLHETLERMAREVNADYASLEARCAELEDRFRAERDAHDRDGVALVKSAKRVAELEAIVEQRNAMLSDRWARIQELEAQKTGLREQHGRDSAELRSLCASRDEARAERNAQFKLNESVSWGKLEADKRVRELEAELAKANSLVYVPGAWKCAKCALRIVSSTLSAVDGSITSNNDPHVCPNGCGPMWRVTERDERKDAYETVELWVGKAQKAEAERDELRRKYDELLRLSHEAIRA